MSRNPAKPEKKYFPGSKWIAGNILCIGFFFDSGRCFYSMYRFFYRFRKMLLEAEIIDSVFYVCHLGYTYIIYFTLARTRRYQGSRWGVKTFNSCTLQNLAQVMPSSLSNLSVHFNLWDKKGHQEIQVHSACCFPPQLSCMWAQWKRNLHGNLLDTNRTARPRCEVQRGAKCSWWCLHELRATWKSWLFIQYYPILFKLSTALHFRIGSPYIICKNGIDLRVGHGWTPRIPKLDTSDALHAPVHRRSEGNPGQCRQAKAQW